MRQYINMVYPLIEQTIVTPRTVTATIEQVAADYIKRKLAPSVYEVNNGLCESLAKDVVELLGGGIGRSVIRPMG